MSSSCICLSDIYYDGRFLSKQFEKGNIFEYVADNGPFDFLTFLVKTYPGFYLIDTKFFKENFIDLIDYRNMKIDKLI